MRHYPVSLFDTFHDFPKMDLFKNFFRDDFSENSSVMALDIREEDDKYLLDAELPGFEKKDVSINVSENVLTIEAKTETLEEDKKYHRRERYVGQYKRSVSLGDNCDATKITASMKNGVLTIEIPKVEPEPAKQIIIQ